VESIKVELVMKAELAMTEEGLNSCTESGSAGGIRK
jgi:hypothetical protein